MENKKAKTTSKSNKKNKKVVNNKNVVKKEEVTKKVKTSNVSSTKVTKNEETKIKENFKEKKEENVSSNKPTLKSDLKAFFNSSIGKLICIVVIIVLIILLFVGITNIIQANGSKDDNENITASIQYDEILISTILNQKNNEYYVFIYDENDAYNTVYNSLESMYSIKDKALKFYSANINSAFNKSFVAEESKISSNLDELKFSGTTLVKVSKGKIVASYENSKDIINHFESIIG